MQQVQQVVIGTGRPGAMMSFEDAMRTCLQDKYVNFEGRASRSEYWWYQLGLVVLQIGFFVVFSILAFLGDIGAILGLLILMVLALGLFLPGLGVLVRRLHDGGRSGWWFLLAVIPFVNFIGVFVILAFMIMDGQPGDNQYGPAPSNTRLG